MLIHDYATGKGQCAVIERMKAKDFKIVKKDKTRFKFNWANLKDQEVYKLRLVRSDTILGLMCIAYRPIEDAIEIVLIEMSAENTGKQKRYGHMAGCMIAFACMQSFQNNHEGYVYLIPKTGIIAHYKTAYGFCHFPLKTAERPAGAMYISGAAANKLIKKYLEDK